MGIERMDGDQVDQLLSALDFAAQLEMGEGELEPNPGVQESDHIAEELAILETELQLPTEREILISGEFTAEELFSKKEGSVSFVQEILDDAAREHPVDPNNPLVLIDLDDEDALKKAAKSGLTTHPYIFVERIFDSQPGTWSNSDPASKARLGDKYRVTYTNDPETINAIRQATIHIGTDNVDIRIPRGTYVMPAKGQDPQYDFS